MENTYTIAELLEEDFEVQAAVLNKLVQAMADECSPALFDNLAAAITRVQKRWQQHTTVSPLLDIATNALHLAVRQLT